MITKIISGGQTGADRGGLDAAIYCKVPHGGWCPKRRKAEDGIIPIEYRLTEMESGEYLTRTQANVIDSDATLIFSHGPLSGGSLQTAKYAHHLEKPYHVIDLLRTSRTKTVEEIVRWLAGDAKLTNHDENQASPPLDCILNVAGSRESHAPGIQDAVFCLMVDVLIKVNPVSQHFYSLEKANTALS